MKIITVINNYRHFFFNLLRLSCALNNLELIVLVSNDEKFKNLHIKDHLLKKYLQEIDRDEVILFTDGNDAVFMTEEKEILEKFSNFKKDIVFSAETTCWPDINMMEEYPPNGNSPYQFLNSGGFIGRVGTIKSLLNDNDYDLKSYPNSNQYLWTKRYFKHPDIIGLDSQCKIFCTFSTASGNAFLPTTEEATQICYYEFMRGWFEQNFLIVNNRIYNKVTDTWPCHAHFNGFSQYLIDQDIVNMVYRKIDGVKEAEFFCE